MNWTEVLLFALIVTPVNSYCTSMEHKMCLLKVVPIDCPSQMLVIFS